MNRIIGFSDFRMIGCLDKLRVLTISLLLLFAATAAKAQSVQVLLTQKVANLPSTASSYIDDPFRYFSIQLIVSGAGSGGIDVYTDFDFRLEGQGSFVNTRPNSFPAQPLHLKEGANMLTPDMIKGQLRGRTETYIDVNNPLNSLQLQEGTYTLCVTPYLWSERNNPNRTPLTAIDGCTNFNICYTGSAPELVSPLAGAQLGLNGFYVLPATRKLTFRWTGVISNCSGSRTHFKYKLKVVKVLPSQNYQDAIRFNPPVFSTEVRNKTFVVLDTLLDAKVQLEHGELYVAEVEAEQINISSNLETLSLSNEGRSQLSTFFWGHESGGHGQGGIADGTDDGDDNGEPSGEEEESGHTRWSVKTRTISNLEELQRKVIPQYIIDWGPDSTTLNNMLLLFPKEKQYVPRPDKRYGREMGVYMVPDTAPLQISFMPARENSLHGSVYELDLFELVGSIQNSESRPAVKHMTINVPDSKIKGDKHDTVCVSLADWKTALETGQRYYLRLHSSSMVSYKEWTINDTTFYVDNIEAETIHDTVHTKSSLGAKVYDNGILFQWGIDSSLFDQLTAAQFTYPVDMSQADLADTSLRHLPSEIVSAVKTESFNIRWKEASGLNYGDTANYTIVVKELKDKQTLQNALKNDTIVNATIRHKNFIDPDDTAFYNKLDVGKKYLLLINTGIDNATKSQYHFAGGKGGNGIPIVFKLEAPTKIEKEINGAISCFEKDTVGMDHKPTWKVSMDTMTRFKIPVKLGRFKLYMQDGKYNKSDSSYKGEGYVLWSPIPDIQFGIKVTFDKLKINKDTMVVSGTAVSSAVDSLGYIKLAGYSDTNSKLAQFDQYSEMANDKMSLLANEMGSTGKEVKSWYDKINKGSNIINSTMQGEKSDVTNFGVFTLPLKLGGDLKGDNSDNLELMVNSMLFSPTTALMSIVGIWSAPSDHIYVPILATNICTEPNHFISDSVNTVSIVMPKNYDFTMPNGHILRFKAPTDFSKPEEGCHVIFDKRHSYQCFNVVVEYEFGKPNDPANKLVPIDVTTGKVKYGNPVCGRFSTAIVNWKEFVVGISMDPFAVIGMEDYMFVVGGKGIFWDHSESYTPPQVTFPKGYHYKELDVTEWLLENAKRDDEGYKKYLNENVFPEESRAKMLKEYQDFWNEHNNWMGVKAAWQGFYIDQFAVFLPPGISNMFSDLDTTTHKRDSAFYIRFSGVNNENKDTVWYTTSDYRMYFGAEHMIFDETNGITLNAQVVNLVDAETKKGGGWAFGLDTIGLTIIANHFDNAFISGTVKVPLFKERIKYKCAIGTDDLVFNVKAAKDKLTMEAWRFSMTLDKTSNFSITHRFDKPKDGNPQTLFDLTLNGTLGLETGDSSISFTGIKYQNMWIRNYPDDATKKELLNKKDTVGFAAYYKEKKDKGITHNKLMNMGDLWLNLGTWSKASPQKSLGRCSNQDEYEEWLRTVQGDEQQRGVGDGSRVDALVALPPEEKKEDDSGAKNGKMGPFSFNLSTFKFYFHDATGDSTMDANSYHYYGIDFGGNVGLEIGKDDKIGVSGGFKLIAALKFEDWDIKCDTVLTRFDSISLDCDISGFGVKGSLVYKENDSIYGNGYMGYLKLTVFDKVEVAVAAGFGTAWHFPDGKMMDIGYSRPKQFSWWFFEGAAVIGSGIPLGPVNLKGFGGGFAYNMKLTKSCANTSPTEMRNAGKGKSLTDGMVASTGLTFTPDLDSWVAKAGIAMCVGDETACDMSGILTLRIVNGHFGGISLMVNAKILAHYDKQADSTDLATINIAAFIDYTDTKDFGQFAFSAAVEGGMNLKNFLDSSSTVTTMIQNNIKTKTESKGEDDGLSQLANFVSPSAKNQKMTQQKSAEEKKDEAEMKKSMDSIYAAQAGNIGGSLNLSVPIELYVKNYKDGKRSPATGDSTEWYFAIGMPATDKRVSFGFDANLVVAKVNMLFTMYFMMGNYFPDSISIPELPKEVRDFLGKDYKPSNGRSFTNFGQSGGFTFGVAAAAHLQFNMALYVDVQAYFGFDVALQKTNGRKCNGHPMGKNDYYAQGQVYTMLKGDVGLGLDLGFWEGHVSLAKAGLGAVLQGGGPNPTWAYGLVKFEAELLGGLCKINTNFDIQLGNVCIEGAGDPMANVKLFQDVSPAYPPEDYKKEENRVSPLARGVVVSNLPWNEELTLSVPRTNGLDVDERMFKFVMLTPDMAAWSPQWYERRDISIASPTPASFTRENFGTKVQPKFTRSDDSPNIYYFEDKEGYFTEGQTYQVHLSAMAMEYREYAKDATYTFKRKGSNFTNDYVIDLTRADLHSTLLKKNELAWRDPLYEHDGDKTVKAYFADTTFFFCTGGLPPTLDNQVVFTWPYNGDPAVPYECFPTDGYNKSYVTIAMKRDRQDIFNAERLKNLNKKLKIFMLKKGDGNDKAKECQYSYLSNGIDNNGVPTLKVYIPSDFTGNKSREQAYCIQVMTITDDSYENIMQRMNRQAEQLAAQTRVTYEQQNGRNVNNIKGGNGSDDVKQQQQQVLKDAYSGMTADTLLNVKKTRLSEYDIYDQGGEKIYSLYYHTSRHNNYSTMLDNEGLPFAEANINNKGSYSGGCLTINSKFSKVAYLFEAWKPNNSRMYASGITLPAICHFAIDAQKSIDAGNELVKRHRALTRRLIDLDAAVKSLDYVYTMPDWVANSYSLYSKNFWYNFGVNLNNQLSSSYAWTSIRSSLAGGLVKEQNGVNMPAAPYRIDVNSWNVGNGTKAVRSNATTTGFDMLDQRVRNAGDTVWGMPAFISVKCTQAKTRIDSAVFYNNIRYKTSYYSTDNLGYCTKELCNNATTYSFIDYATPALVNDCNNMGRFFNDVYSYSYSIMYMNMKTRADNLKNYYKAGKTYTKHLFGHGFTYTLPEVAFYSAYYQALNWNYRYYFENKNLYDKANSQIEKETYLEQMYKPVSLATRDATPYGSKTSVWYRNFILFDQYPPACEDVFGMLFRRTFSNQTQSSGKYNIASFYGGLVNPVTYSSKGFSGSNKQYQTNTKVTWKLRVWIAQIDELNAGKQLLKEMIVKVKNNEGSSSPVIMVNRRYGDDNKVSTYYTYPYMINSSISYNSRIRHEQPYGLNQANSWRNNYPNEKSKNSIKEFTVSNK